MAERKIGDREFRVKPMLATKALALKARLLKTLGPAIDRLPEILAGAGEADEQSKAKSNAAALAAISSIFTDGDPDEMVRLLSDVCSLAEIKRPSGVYDVVDIDADFIDDLNGVYSLTIFVLQTQFSGFFSGSLLTGFSEAKKAG